MVGEPAARVAEPHGDWRQLLPEADTGSQPAEPELSVLCRSLEQLEAACGEVPVAYCDFEDIRLYKDAVARVREAGSRTRVFLATPRIQKAGESGYFKLIERAEPEWCPGSKPRWNRLLR